LLAATGRLSGIYTDAQEVLLNHYVLVDRHNGQMKLIGFWNSREALEAAMSTLESARERLWNSFQEPPTLGAYEIADEL